MSKITALFRALVNLAFSGGMHVMWAIQTACIIAFIITGAGLTITAGWLWLSTAVRIAMILPVVPLVLFGVLLIMTLAGGAIVATKLKDTELDDIWGLLQCYLLSGIAIAWEALVVVIKFLITKKV